MKTFNQFLNESEHDHAPYSDWGLIHPTKGIISGQNHPKAQNHLDLSYHTKTSMLHSAGYGVSKHELNISGEHTGISSALKHWDKIPKHPEGNTRAEFSGPGKNYFRAQGHHKNVYNKLKDYHSQMKDSE